MPAENASSLQSIPRSAVRFCLAAERFCLSLPGVKIPGSSIVVAYSGGADSKALLLALHYLAPRLNLTLRAAVLDHMLRPESGAEVAMAADFCERKGIAFHSTRRDVAALAKNAGAGLEEAGRLARQAYLEEVRRETGSDWIAFGHQLNDLAEDALMRMVRGAGWPALGGMEALIPERKIIRPLLLTARASIEAFLTALGESWVCDAMNEDDAYLRNRIRQHIVPALLRENPSYLDGVAERWRMAREDGELFRSLLASITPEERDGGLFFPRAILAGAPAALRLRKYMAVLSAMGEGQANAALLRNLDAAWRRNEGGKIVQFPGAKRAVIKGGGIFFFSVATGE